MNMVNKAGIASKELYGPTLKRDHRQAEKHMVALNPKAGHVFPHCMATLEEGIQGRIIDPQASKKTNPLSRNVHLLLLYHLLKKRKHLPEEVSKEIAGPLQIGKKTAEGSFGLFNMARSRMYRGDVRGFASFFADERIPIQKRLETLLAHMADAMTLHSPETMAALPYGSLRIKNDGSDYLFVNPLRQWEVQVPKMAKVMSKVLCPVADLFGNSYVYRKIRDVSAQHIYPEIFNEVANGLRALQAEIMRTNLLVEEIVRRANDECERKGFGIKTIRRNQDDTRSRELNDEEHKSRGSITDKLAKRRSKGEEGKITDLHDIVARMVIVRNMEELGFVTRYLKDHAIPSVLASYGVSSMIDITDYVTAPKEKTGYQSFHIDTIVNAVDYLNFEFIIRTVEMHDDADRGQAAHHMYKDGILKNGLLLSFKQLFEEIQKNGRTTL